MTDYYTVVVKGEYKKSTNLFDVLDIIKRFESEGQEVLVFSSKPIESNIFKRRVKNIYA